MTTANVRLYSRGAFHFCQGVLPLLLDSTDLQYPPTLIFTGATAAMRGSAQLSAFSTGKFALRSLTQSLSKEFGPKGVHVTHAIIDGVIDTEKTKEWKLDGPDSKINPDAVGSLLGLVQHFLSGMIKPVANFSYLDRLRTHIGIYIHSPGHHLPTRLILGQVERSGRLEI